MTKSFSPAPHIKIQVTPFNNLLFLGFAECQLVPLQQRGGQEEKLGFFSSTLFILNALSVSALMCFLFFFNLNISTSASITDGLFSPIILQRGEGAMPVQRADHCPPSWNGPALSHRPVTQGCLALLPEFPCSSSHAHRDTGCSRDLHCGRNDPGSRCRSWVGAIVRL